ncbi:MAG: aminotransferase class IV [Solirubrobacteraceae bacterium]
MSVDHDIVLRWSQHGLQPLGAEPVAELLAVDSWLVRDGAVRGYDSHWGRFGGWCAELGVPAGVLAGFRAGVTAALPRAGRWFPRVELVEGRRLQLRLRAARAAEREARVIIGPRGDPRTRPRCKGPDIELLLALRAQAGAAGADELLLCDDEGRLVEGAFDSLLWWEGDTLCTTPADHTLPGVTRALLLAIAHERGVLVRVRSPFAAELAERETWLTNALHGIRFVSAWGETAAATATRAAGWQAELEGTARPV